MSVPELAAVVVVPEVGSNPRFALPARHVHES